VVFVRRRHQPRRPLQAKIRQVSAQRGLSFGEEAPQKGPDQQCLDFGTLLRGPVLRLRTKGAEYQKFSLCRGIASSSRTEPQARRGFPAGILPSALAGAQRLLSTEQEESFL
jgi:hypothetical protein